MKKAFLDTNILIANVFFLNSLHFKSQMVFDEYDEVFWSNFVQYEFHRRYMIKEKNIRSFFNNLQKYFENPEKEFYSAFDLKKFALNKYSGKFMKDAESSIDSFWNEYFGIETQMSFFEIKNAIMYCLNDLSITSNKCKKDLKQSINLTPKRINKYSRIDKMLENEGVKPADRTVTLDGHDFACFSNDPVDFITFDLDCFKGAKNIKILCFDSIKGKFDFN
ncbi:hypothetical protein J5751_01550 [bacterium]|nr:hypothetical protein [bacterium]